MVFCPQKSKKTRIFMTGLKYLLYTAMELHTKAIVKNQYNINKVCCISEGQEMSWNYSIIWIQHMISIMGSK